jgi:hypothetical protein
MRKRRPSTEELIKYIESQYNDIHSFKKSPTIINGIIKTVIVRRFFDNIYAHDIIIPLGVYENYLLSKKLEML